MCRTLNDICKTATTAGARSLAAGHEGADSVGAHEAVAGDAKHRVTCAKALCADDRHGSAGGGLCN